MDSNYIGMLIAQENGSKSQLNMKKFFMESLLQQMRPSRTVRFAPSIGIVNPVKSIDVEQTGRYLLSGRSDGSIYIHDLYNRTGEDPEETLIPVASYFRSDGVFSIHGEIVQWFPQNPGLFSSSGKDHKVRIWDANAMVTVENYDTQSVVYYHEVSPTHSSPIIAAATEVNGVRILDVRTGQSQQQLTGHSGPVISVAWSPTDDNLLVTGGSDGRILMWDTKSARRPIASLNQKKKHCREPLAHEGCVSGLSFSPNGRILMSIGSSDKTPCSWIVNTMSCSQVKYERYPQFRITKHAHTNLSVNGSGNYNVCFLPTSSAAYVIRVETGEDIACLSGHFGSVICCYFHEERMEIYTAAKDGGIMLWSKPFEDESSGIENNSNTFWCDSSSEYDPDDT